MKSKLSMDGKDKSLADKPPVADIAVQLDRILQHANFRRAPKQAALLRFLVEKSIGGRLDLLRERAIAKHVFGELRGFDTTQVSRVRVAVHRLRLALKLYFLEEAESAEVIISLPPRSYVPEFRRSINGETNWQSAALPHGVLKAEMGDQLAREYWNYQRNASPEAHAETFQKFRRALEEQPECAILHAIVAELALDGCAVGLLDQCHGFDIAHASLERARKLDGDNPHLFVSMAFAAIAQGDLPAARQAASLLRQPSVEPALGAIGVWFDSVCSSESGIGNGNLRAFERASDMISWLRLIEFLKAYRMRDYEKALSEAIWFGMPDFMWGPLLRAAAFGQLGLQSCALREIESLQSISPGFELRPLQYIKYYLPLDADAEHVLEGLQRAGL